MKHISNTNLALPLSRLDLIEISDLNLVSEMKQANSKAECYCTS